MHSGYLRAPVIVFSLGAIGLVEQCHAANRTLTDCNDEVDAEGGVRTPRSPPGYATVVCLILEIVLLKCIYTMQRAFHS